MGNFRKEITNNLKNSLRDIKISNGITKYRSDGLDLIWEDKKIGRLGLAIVSKKFAENGALFGGYVVANINDGKVVSFLKKLNLTYKSFLHENHFFGFSSLYFKSKLFFEEGTVSFYEEDNLEEKSNKIVRKVNDLYVEELDNFINYRWDTINDVFECAKNYGRPTATILSICVLNNRAYMIDELMEKAKKRKLFDAFLLNEENIKQFKED